MQRLEEWNSGVLGYWSAHEIWVYLVVIQILYNYERTCLDYYCITANIFFL